MYSVEVRNGLYDIERGRRKVGLGTPFRASLVSFTVGLAATTIAALLIGQVTGGL